MPSAARATPSVGVGTWDRPDVRWYVSEARILRLRAIHEPDRHIAAGVAPQNVTLAVAVEVSSLNDRPHGGYVSDPRILRLRAVHEPDRHIAAGVAPQNVALAVPVEVPGSDDRPRGWDASDSSILRLRRAH